VDETDHFFKCEACGGWIDMPISAQCSIMKGRCPHPADDQAAMTNAHLLRLRCLSSAPMTATAVPGEAFECPNAATAILQAEFLSQAAGNVGAIAFSRPAIPMSASSKTRWCSRRFGDLSVDLTMLF